MWISDGGGGPLNVDRKNPYCEYYYFEKVDKPKGGSNNVDKVILLNFDAL